eukprot:3433163-Lingulodinium_polyedra.AAC.1
MQYRIVRSLDVDKEQHARPAACLGRLERPSDQRRCHVDGPVLDAAELAGVQGGGNARLAPAAQEAVARLHHQRPDGDG